MKNLGRYPGINSFDSKLAPFFFGREREIKVLSRKILQNRSLLLHGESGSGKTSLLQAGIIPFFQQKAEYQSYYISLEDYAPSQPDILKRIFEALDPSIGDPDLLPFEDDGSLWYKLKNHQFATNRDSRIILMIDQFEKLFTFPPDEIQRVADVLAELIYVQIPLRYRETIDASIEAQLSGKILSDKLELLLKPLDISFVFSMKSEHLGMLEQISPTLTNIFFNRFALKNLATTQAEEAIIGPAYMDDPDFSSSPPFDLS